MVVLTSVRFTLTEVQRMVYEGFDIVTPQRWQSLITHVKEKVEDHYWEADGLHEELLERFIINTSSDSSDDDISDSGEDADSMEISDSAEDVCSSSYIYNFIIVLCIYYAGVIKHLNIIQPTDDIAL